MTDLEMAEAQIKKWDSLLYPQMYPVALVKDFIRKAYLEGLREWAKDTSKMIYYKTQSTKAKEIIKELLESCFGYNSKTVDYEIKARAEKFLKENE